MLRSEPTSFLCCTSCGHPAMKAKSGTTWNESEQWHGAIVGHEIADDIPLLAKTSGTLIYLLATLVDTLEGVGLRLNVSKTVLAITETQLRNHKRHFFPTTSPGEQIKFLNPEQSHAWFACV